MICQKNKCTGCFACFNICPKMAIDMVEDEYGNVYPSINQDKCINCNLCRKICPELHKKELKKPLKAFAMYNKNNKIRSQSTSGGAATTFYMKVLNDDGVVYGASNLFGKTSIDFLRIDNVNDLYKLKGSKYVHCYVQNTFKQVKKDLLDGRKVMFIGTPCQIAGLKSFLENDYNNLITVDLICHGVPSQKLLKEDLISHNLNLEDIYYLRFRDDSGFNLSVYGINNNLIENLYVDDYYKNFLASNIYRENCYECQYATLNRISDITIGDFWGLDKNSKIYDDEKKGISLVIPITEKGMKFIESIKNEVAIEERTISEAILENKQLNHPSICNYKKRKKYIKYYPILGFTKSMRKMENLKDKLKRLQLYKILKNKMLDKKEKK